MKPATKDPDQGSARPALIPPANADDLSGNGHRQLLGWLGILLPLMVCLGAGLRPAAHVDPWKMLPSISGYYHTGAVVFFIGIVVALGLFLNTYHGYDNADGWKDRLASNIAGYAALLLAAFPTKVEGGYPAPDWWTPLMGKLHLAGASTLFIAFAYMSFFLFPSGTDHLTKEKKRRNLVHQSSGIIIAACLIWALVAGFILEGPIFWPETIMLLAFGVSWLTKGKVDKTAKAIVQRISGDPAE